MPKPTPKPPVRELAAPSATPVPWVVVRNDDPRRMVIIETRFAYDAITEATMTLKDNAAAPCLSRDAVRVLR